MAKDLTKLYSRPGAEAFHVFEDDSGQVQVKMGGRTAVTAVPSGPGLEIQGGSETRSFVTAEMSGGVPTGNFM